MKVYLLWCNERYEASILLGVYATREAAELRCPEETDQETGSWCSVEEREVEDTEEVRREDIKTVLDHLKAVERELGHAQYIANLKVQEIARERDTLRDNAAVVIDVVAKTMRENEKLRERLKTAQEHKE